MLHRLYPLMFAELPVANVICVPETHGSVVIEAMGDSQDSLDCLFEAAPDMHGIHSCSSTRGVT